VSLVWMTCSENGPSAGVVESERVAVGTGVEVVAGVGVASGGVGVLPLVP
jgi:hypothetical protein